MSRTTDEILDALPEGPTTHDRATIERASLLFSQDKNLHWNEALAQAAAQLAVEAEQRAEAEAATKAQIDSFRRLIACGACGVPTFGPERLCPPCLRVAMAIRAERSGAEVIGDHTRRELVEACLDRREQAR